MTTEEGNAALSKYYDEHFNELYNSEAAEIRWQQIQNAILKSFPSSSKNLSILDLGCSGGWFSNKLKTYGSVTGIDFSEQSIASAKNQFRGIDFRVMDITSDSIKNLGKEKFDLIISSEVMEHITDHSVFLNQISYLLKKDGVVILTTPNGKWYSAYFTNEMQQYKQPIENWTDTTRLKSLLQREFKLINSKTFYANWIYSSRTTTLVKILSNDYIRAGLIKISLFNTYLNLLEKFGCGLYLIISAKKKG